MAVTVPPVQAITAPESARQLTKLHPWLSTTSPPGTKSAPPSAVGAAAFVHKVPFVMRTDGSPNILRRPPDVPAIAVSKEQPATVILNQ